MGALQGLIVVVLVLALILVAALTVAVGWIIGTLYLWLDGSDENEKLTWWNRRR